MSNEYLIYLNAFFIGILSSFHCIGMCGAINIALSINTKISSIKYFYNVGRIISYSILGIITGIFGAFIIKFFDTQYFFLFKFLNGLILFFIGLNLIGFFRQLFFFEKIALYIWNFFSFFFKKIKPINSKSKAILIGMIWGNMPCGLLYGMIIWSISFGSLIKSVLIMIFFGFGTLPGMLITNKYLIKKSENLIFNKIGSGILIFSSVMVMYTAFFSKQCH